MELTNQQTQPRSLIERLKDNWLAVIVTIVISASATTWKVFNAVVEKPLRDDITRKNDMIESLRRDVSRLRQVEAEYLVLKRNVANNKSLVISKGEIYKPEENEFFKSGFACEVSIKSPIEGSYYYLAVEYGNRHWPIQEIQPLPDNGRVKMVVNLSDTVLRAHPFLSGLFIVIVQVDIKQKRIIEQWFQGPKETAMKIGGKQLARRSVRRRPI